MVVLFSSTVRDIFLKINLHHFEEFGLEQEVDVYSLSLFFPIAVEKILPYGYAVITQRRCHH